MASVHVKDARVVDWSSGLTAWMPVGGGEVDMVGQMAALRRDGFAVPLLLETHWRGEGLDREASSRHSFAGLLDVLRRGAASPAAP
jgi:sugar phosphate isomerase/epimerase